VKAHAHKEYEMTYRRVVTGVSSTIKFVHLFNRLLLKYEGRILTWALGEFDASTVQKINDLFELIHALDPLLQNAEDD